MALCAHCGSQMSDTAASCPECGHPAALSADVKVPNYLVFSILATIFFCLPFGIVSIIYAARVNTKREAGDLIGAMEASRFAKMWAWISVGAGLIAMIIWAVRIASLGDLG